MKKHFDYKLIVNFFDYTYELQTNYNIINQIKSIFLNKWSHSGDTKSDILLFQSLHRYDYNIFTEEIYKLIETKNKSFIKLNPVNQLNFEIKNISFIEYLNIYKSLKDINCFKKKVFIFIEIIKIMKITNLINKYTPKLVILHADMQPVENIISQFFNHKDIPTATLQHGLYIDYQSNPNINEVNYKNIVSRYFLAWGEETKELIQKYKLNVNVKVLGNPLENNTIIKKEKFFTVIFEHEGNKEFNFVLLIIARKISIQLNLELKIKLHPNNTFKDYKIKREEIIKFDNIYNSSFVIGHTSSMLYQIMGKDIPIFKLKSDSPSNKTHEKFIFRNTLELEDKLNMIDSIDYKKESEYYIKYSDSNSKKNYKKFFDSYIL